MGKGEKDLTLPLPARPPECSGGMGLLFGLEAQRSLFFPGRAKRSAFSLPGVNQRGSAALDGVSSIAGELGVPRELPAEWGPEASSAPSPPREKLRPRQGPDHQPCHKIHKTNAHGQKSNAVNCLPLQQGTRIQINLPSPVLIYTGLGTSTFTADCISFCLPLLLRTPFPKSRFPCCVSRLTMVNTTMFSSQFFFLY